MILDVAECPYCRTVSAVVDCSVPRFCLAAVCPHVAFLSAALDARRENGNQVRSRAGSWFWSRTGRRILTQESSKLSRYVDSIACELLDDSEYPSVPYKLGGGTASDREIVRPGSGEIQLPARGILLGTFDAWGIYSPDPQALIHEVEQLAGLRDQVCQ